MSNPLSQPVRGAIIAALSLAAAACATPAPPTKEARPPSPRQVFLAKCSRCHPPEQAYSSIAVRETWIRKVASMAARDLKWIDAASMKAIIAYADEHPAAVRETFTRKCGSCHQWDVLRTLEKNPAQWRTMITFMGRRCPDGLTQEEGEMIWRALAAR